MPVIKKQTTFKPDEIQALKQFGDLLGLTNLVKAAERIADALDLIAGHLETIGDNTLHVASVADAIEGLKVDVNFVANNLPRCQA